MKSWQVLRKDLIIMLGSLQLHIRIYVHSSLRGENIKCSMRKRRRSFLTFFLQGVDCILTSKLPHTSERFCL